MAENESLDLGDPGGQRWRHVLDAVRKRKSAKDVAHQVQLKLPKALRKAFKEFTESGVALEQFLKGRNDQTALRQLVRKCDGHEYANLFVETAAISMGKSDQQLFVSYLNGVLDRIADQIIHKVVGNEWQTISETQKLFRDVREIVKPDVERIAKGLAESPNRNPTTRPKLKGTKEEQTKDLLRVSMLGDKR